MWLGDFLCMTRCQPADFDLWCCLGCEIELKRAFQPPAPFCRLTACPWKLTLQPSPVGRVVGEQATLQQGSILVLFWRAGTPTSTYPWLDEEAHPHEVRHGEGGEQGDLPVLALYSLAQQQALSQLQSCFGDCDGGSSFLHDVGIMHMRGFRSI